MKRSSALGGPIAALLLSLCVVTSPSPASADSVVVESPSGGVPAFIDLTRVRATNGAHRVRTVVHVRDLDDRGRFSLSYTHQGAGTYAVITMSDAGPVVRMFHSKSGGDSDPRVECPGARVTWQDAKNTIDFSAPQQCLKWYFDPPSAWRFHVGSSARTDGTLVYDSVKAVKVYQSS